MVGVGNPLRSDDAVGLHVARRLRESLACDPQVAVEEQWAGGLRLAEAMAGYDRAVVVDAIEDPAAPPGTLRRLELGDLGSARNLACAHDTSLPSALAVWRALGLPLPAAVAVWGIVAADTDTLSEALTDAVARAVPAAAAAILEELRADSAPGVRP